MAVFGKETSYFVVNLPLYKKVNLFIDINPSDRTMTLGSKQPLTEMSTGIISWV
jgi:hypothetical protein